MGLGFFKTNLGWAVPIPEGLWHRVWVKRGGTVGMGDKISQGKYIVESGPPRRHAVSLFKLD